MKTRPATELLSVSAENDNIDRSDSPDRIAFDEHDGRALLHVVADGIMHGGLALLHGKIGTVRLARGVSRLRPGPGRDAMERYIDDERGPIPIIRRRTSTRVERTSSGPVPSVASEPSAFLDEKQLCAELGISPVTATKWRRKAKGPPFVRVGRLIRYPRETFDRWLAERTVGAPATS